MPEENSADSPSAFSADKNDSDAGKQPSPPPKQRNSTRFYRYWLLLGIVALGIAIAFSLESKTWQEARNIFVEWIERLNLDSDSARLPPEPQENPPKASQPPAVMMRW